jgi:hypothetical protein
MTIATENTIDLGRLGNDDDATGLRHRLLHLRDRDGVVMPYVQAQGGWECLVVATRQPRQHHRHRLTLTDDELAEGFGRVPAEPDRDPDGYARLAWMSQAYRHWPGGAALALTRHIVDTLRAPHSLHVPTAALVDHTAIARLLPTMRPVEVGRLHDDLATVGFLTRSTPDSWRLTLPGRSHGERTRPGT